MPGQEERVREEYGLIERPDLPYGLRVMELDQKMRAEEPILFLDVREEWERSIYPFMDGIHIPYSRLQQEWKGLTPHKDREIVVCCLFGWRSREAARSPHRQGVQECLEPGRRLGGVDPVPGGIDSEEVDMNHANVTLNADGRGSAR